MAALHAADRVWAAGIVGTGRQRVVAALAVDPADRVDRREIEHVEAHVADIGQPADHVVEGAVPRRIAALRAREHLVPGGEAGARPIDEHLELVPVARSVGADAGPLHQRAHVLAEHDLQEPPLVVALGAELLQQRPQRLLIGALGLLEGALQEQAPLGQLERHVQPGVVLLHHLGAPAFEQVAPGLDGVDVAAVAHDRKAAGPAIVLDQRHRRLAPGALVLGAVLDAGGNLVVAVAEDVRLDLDHVADHALDRMPSAVELRLDPLDHHPVARQARTGVARRHRGPASRAARPASLAPPHGRGIPAATTAPGRSSGPARTVPAAAPASRPRTG